MVLFVGNLNHAATTKDLELLFSAFGKIKSLELVTDHITRRSRGCAYIQMEEDASAQSAMTSLNNTVYMDKTITVTDKGPRQRSTNGIHTATGKK
jgi:RNA recognition motif-containing protein